MDLRSGHPFWLLKNGILATYPALAADETCDVAIIGGGITGALVSYRLVNEGWRSFCSTGLPTLQAFTRNLRARPARVAIPPGR